MASNLSIEEAALRKRIFLETELIAWAELKMFFAKGKAVFVSDSLNLVDVAFQMARDNQLVVSDWMKRGLVRRLTDDQAGDWFERRVEVRASVIQPWVLVQENTEQPVAPLHSASHSQPR